MSISIILTLVSPPETFFLSEDSMLSLLEINYVYNYLSTEQSSSYDSFSILLNAFSSASVMLILSILVCFIKDLSSLSS